MLQGLIKNHIDDDAFLNDMRRMQSGIGMENDSEKLIEKTKKMLIATNNRGVALYKQGKYHEALELLQQAADTMPDNKTIIINMLQIIVHDLKNGDYSEDKMLRAEGLFKKARQIGVDVHKISQLKMQLIDLSQQRKNGVRKPS
jgi:tetratricopeptide (TPR) repeat protein